MKTGVLVHGCNLNIENWRHVAWGDPPNQLGRIPQGILVAAQTNADVIVFGTGASQKTFRLGESDKTGQVLSEAEYSLEYLKIHFSSLAKFDPLKSRIPELANEASSKELADAMFDKIRLDVESMNTVEEIANAGKIFAELGVEQAILVSSPFSHCSLSARRRCHVWW